MIPPPSGVHVKKHGRSFKYFTRTYPMPKNACYRSLLWLTVSIALYIIGSWQHLDLATFLDPNIIFGDDGDGFFNLWILEHNKQYFFSGLFSWTDGRIFWPENQMSLFWSDILLLPTLPFAFLRMIGVEMFIAYKATFFILSVASYITILTLFLQLSHWCSDNTTRQANVISWLSPIMAFALTFSINQLGFFLHFQNLNWFCIGIILLGIIGFTVTEQRWYLGMAFAMEAALLWSAPYFAVFSIPLFAIWAVLHGIRQRANIIPQLRATQFLWILTALLCSIPAYLYHQAPHIEYSALDLHRMMATHWQHFFLPPKGLLHDVMELYGLKVNTTNNESGAYLGLGIEILLIGWLFMAIVNNKQKYLSFPKSPLFVVLLICYLSYRLTITSAPAASYLLAWLTLVLFLILLGHILKQQALLSPAGFISSMLFAVVIIAFGLSLGPNHHFANAYFNPSIYGLLKITIPGVSNMRAIGRIAAIGQIFLGLWLFLEYNKFYFQKDCPRWKIRVLCILTIGLSLQITESWPVQAKTHRYAIEKTFTLSKTDQEVLEKLNGTACFFPTRPWYKNTHAMLYLRSLPNITLINGYSAHSTPLFDKLMDSPKNDNTYEHEPTTAQLKILDEIKCNYVLIWKNKIDWSTFKTVTDKHQLIGETSKIVILQM